jgi:hypothetical protein
MTYAGRTSKSNFSRIVRVVYVKYLSIHSLRALTSDRLYREHLAITYNTSFYALVSNTLRDRKLTLFSHSNTANFRYFLS